MNAARAQIEIGPGELCDRLSILEIKAERTRGGPAEAATEAQRDALRAVRARQKLPEAAAPIERALAALNGELWRAEDAIRACERAGDFGPAFIELARRVRRMNDRRAAMKAEIDRLAGLAEATEVKVYAD